MKQTYIVAKATGDQRYLFWLWERMTLVYKESPLLDYVQTLESFGDYFHRRANVPRWLDWLLRKYNL
jgi:hypothetical protein